MMQHDDCAGGPLAGTRVVEFGAIGPLPICRNLIAREFLDGRSDPV